MNIETVIRQKIETRFLESEWFKSRPQVVREALRIIPPGSVVVIDGKEFFALGIGEVDGDLLDQRAMLSEHNPTASEESHRLAQENYVSICLKHLVPTE